jgi:uncharacterized membrane protein
MLRNSDWPLAAVLVLAAAVSSMLPRRVAVAGYLILVVLLAIFVYKRSKYHDR